jgi:hypothetical protein
MKRYLLIMAALLPFSIEACQLRVALQKRVFMTQKSEGEHVIALKIYYPLTLKDQVLGDVAYFNEQNEGHTLIMARTYNALDPLQPVIKTGYGVSFFTVDKKSYQHSGISFKYVTNPDAVMSCGALATYEFKQLNDTIPADFAEMRDNHQNASH